MKSPTTASPLSSVRESPKYPFLKKCSFLHNLLDFSSEKVYNAPATAAGSSCCTNINTEQIAMSKNYDHIVGPKGSVSVSSSSKQPVGALLCAYTLQDELTLFHQEHERQRKVEQMLNELRMHDVVYIDTCSLMNEGAAMFFKQIKDELKKRNIRIHLIPQVKRELRSKACLSPQNPADEAAAQSAKQALRLLRKYKRIITEDSIGEEKDHVDRLYCRIFLLNRPYRSQLLITQDRDLAWSILQANSKAGYTGRARTKVLRLNRFGCFSGFFFDDKPTPPRPSSGALEQVANYIPYHYAPASASLPANKSNAGFSAPENLKQVLDEKVCYITQLALRDALDNNNRMAFLTHLSALQHQCRCGKIHIMSASLTPELREKLSASGYLPLFEIEERYSGHTEMDALLAAVSNETCWGDEKDRLIICHNPALYREIFHLLPTCFRRPMVFGSIIARDGYLLQAVSEDSGQTRLAA